MIRIICVGKIKETFLKEAINEYKKRISKFTQLEIIEVEDESFDDINKVLSTEKDKIMKYLNIKSFIITLEIDGKQLSSVELSKKIEDIYIQNSNIIFIIGGSYGLDDEIKNMSNMSLSFSKLTFPHQLFRVMLLEQIYRSYKIINNEKYHK